MRLLQRGTDQASIKEPAGCTMSVLGGQLKNQAKQTPDAEDEAKQRSDGTF